MSTATNDDLLNELREIKKLLTPAPAAAAPKGIWNEFKSFLEQYKVLGLAVGFIMGLYLGNLVKALVTDLVLPIVALFLPPGTDINTYKIGPFGVGDFFNNLLTFILGIIVHSNAPGDTLIGTVVANNTLSSNGPDDEIGESSPAGIHLLQESLL